MRIATRSLAVAALVALALSIAVTPAFAAATKTQWQNVEVRLVNGQGNLPGMLVYGEINASAKLPADVSLAVPNGTSLDWAGEILGGAPQNDPTVQYTTKAAQGYDEIFFTLTRSRRGQVEYVASSAITTDGAGKKATIAWTSPADLPAVGLFIEVPNGGTVTNPDNAQSTKIGNSKFYFKQFQRVRKGQALKLSVSYVGGAFAPQPNSGTATGTSTATATSGNNTVLLAGVAIAAILGLMFFVMRRASVPAYVEEEPEPVRKPRTRSTSSSAAKSGTGGTRKTAASSGAKPAAKPAARTASKPKAADVDPDDPFSDAEAS